MTENGKDPWMKKAKRITVIGAAFLMLIAVVGGAGTIVKWAWGAAQKIESYTKLPEWLRRVEGKVDENGRKIDEVGGKIQRIYDEVQRHRGRTDD